MNKNERNKADWIVREINSNPLDDDEADILRAAVKKIRDKRRKDFDTHLKQAAKIVAGWPKWKQEALGVIKRPSSR